MVLSGRIRPRSGSQLHTEFIRQVLNCFPGRDTGLPLLESPDRFPPQVCALGRVDQEVIPFRTHYDHRSLAVLRDRFDASVPDTLEVFACAVAKMATAVAARSGSLVERAGGSAEVGPQAEAVPASDETLVADFEDGLGSSIGAG